MKYNTYIIPDKNGDWLIVPRKGFPLKWPYERSLFLKEKTVNDQKIQRLVRTSGKGFTFCLTWYPPIDTKLAGNRTGTPRDTWELLKTNEALNISDS